VERVKRKREINWQVEIGKWKLEGGKWTKRLEQETTEVQPSESDVGTLGVQSPEASKTLKTSSVLIFRLGVEWFGLSAKLFR